MNNYYDSISTQYEEVVLERIKFGIEQHLSREFLFNHSVRIEDKFDLIASQIVVMVRFELYGKSHKVVDIKYPENWKESFKERWFPKWLKDKYPVKYHCHHIDFYEVYPKIAPALPHMEYVRIPYIQDYVAK